MKLIAAKSEENIIIEDLAKELRAKNIYTETIKYEDGFGVNVWSVNDMLNFPETNDWPHDEKIRFMEYAGQELGGATDDDWEIFKTLIKQFIDDRKSTNIAYVEDNYDEFEKTKFYIDVCGGGWVRMVYYNPDSNAGGQLVYDLLSDYVISEAGKNMTTEDEFWNHLYAYSKQTLADIDTCYFAGYAKEFVEAPCDYTDQKADVIEKLKQWAEISLKKGDAQ